MSSNSSPASVIVNTSDKEPAEDKSESTNQPTNCKRDRQEFELDASQESVSSPRNDCILAKKRKLDNAAEKEVGVYTLIESKVAIQYISVVVCQ